MDRTSDPHDRITPEEYRERGKRLLKSENVADRSEGISCILKAYAAHDAEAAYLVGDLMLRGAVRPKEGVPEERALGILRGAAKKGNLQARALLNSYCLKRYEKAVGAEKRENAGPLTDFDGKPIRISRRGVLTPVDAVLTHADGINLLTLRANVLFLGENALGDPAGFRRAVLDGFREWQGEYRVFGGQLLRVVVHLTQERRFWDNVVVVPITDALGDFVQSIVNTVGTKKDKKRITNLIGKRRSFAGVGLLRWSARSRKLIYMLSKDGRFADYEELRQVAKHEFGHVLGLGDLYASPSDRLEGVEKGTYPELDGFHVTDKIYNLVMCDQHGPISNNEIEMVLLAFRKNRAQLYQKGVLKGEISAALGKGN